MGSDNEVGETLGELNADSWPHLLQTVQLSCGMLTNGLPSAYSPLLNFLPAALIFHMMANGLPRAVKMTRYILWVLLIILLIQISMASGRISHRIPVSATINALAWNPKQPILAYSGTDTLQVSNSVSTRSTPIWLYQIP